MIDVERHVPSRSSTGVRDGAVGVAFPHPGAKATQIASAMLAA
jgi:hypothetical protein